MTTKSKLQIGQAYIVDNKPMVLTDITYGRHTFTDGLFGAGRTLGRRPSDAKILDSLQIAEGVNPQDILDKRNSIINNAINYSRDNTMKTDNKEIEADFRTYWLEPLDNALQEILKCDARQAPISEQGYTHLALAELSQLRVGIQYLKDILDDPLSEPSDRAETRKDLGTFKQALQGYDIEEELGRLSL